MWFLPLLYRIQSKVIPATFIFSTNDSCYFYIVPYSVQSISCYFYIQSKVIPATFIFSPKWFLLNICLNLKLIFFVLFIYWKVECTILITNEYLYNIYTVHNIYNSIKSTNLKYFTIFFNKKFPQNPFAEQLFKNNYVLQWKKKQKLLVKSMFLSLF